MTDRRCIVCTRDVAETEQTCPGCIGQTRRDLDEIVRLYALLPYQARASAVSAGWSPSGSRSSDTKVPGGDALVMLAGGYVGTGDHDAQLDDPEPVLALLASWEDSWRRIMGMPAANHLANVSSCVRFFDEHLARMAQWRV